MDSCCLTSLNTKEAFRIDIKWSECHQACSTPSRAGHFRSDDSVSTIVTGKGGGGNDGISGDYIIYDSCLN